MNSRDLHQSLKSEVIATVRTRHANFSVARLQWGKDDIAFSLHAAPHTFTTAGYQITDFLSHLNFSRSPCPFLDRRECYARWIEPGFDAQTFASLFDQAFNALQEAEKDLKKCGFLFDQPEGWGYYFGKYSAGRRRDVSMSGDGHTAAEHRLLKTSEDDGFLFKFIWLKNDERDKGWVIHYRPKHLPLSSEIQSVFQFLDIINFASRPEYNFESCYWRSILFTQRGDDFFDGNTSMAHSWFDAHATHFSPGIKNLLDANAYIEKAGLTFLPFPSPKLRLNIDIEKRIVKPADTQRMGITGEFDIAISFAGTQRPYAERLAQLVRDAGFSVFYDDFYAEYLWGKNLVDTFDQIYRKRARYCVIFVSREYIERDWTNYERQSAQARAIQEKGREYILPIKMDDAELPGLPPTIGYLSINRGIEKISEILIKKLHSER